MDEEPAVEAPIKFASLRRDGLTHVEDAVPISKARKMARDARRQGRREGWAAAEREREAVAAGLVSRYTEQYAEYMYSDRQRDGLLALGYKNGKKLPKDANSMAVPTGMESGVHPFRLDADTCLGVSIVRLGASSGAAPQFAGTARRHPDDRGNPLVGLNLAAARAFFEAAVYYFDLANQHATCHLTPPWGKRGTP